MSWLRGPREGGSEPAELWATWDGGEGVAGGRRIFLEAEVPRDKQESCGPAKTLPGWQRKWREVLCTLLPGGGGVAGAVSDMTS